MAKKKSAIKKKSSAVKKSSVRKSAAKISTSKKPSGKKASAKKSAKAARQPKAPVLPWRQPLVGETKVGVVEDYFSHVNVIALTLARPLVVGDQIHVHGHTTDLKLPVSSMQIEHQEVPRAAAGAAVGIKVTDRCRKGDFVFLIN